jgi:hypothetical protein
MQQLSGINATLGNSKVLPMTTTRDNPALTELVELLEQIKPAALLSTQSPPSSETGLRPLYCSA